MQGFGTSPLELMSCDAMLKGEVFLQGFTYSAKFIAGTGTALPASASADSPVQINADSDFVVQEMNFQSFLNVGVPIANPDYLLMLVSAGAGRQLMSQSQHIMNYTGGFVTTNSVQVPSRLPMPMLFTSNTTITVTLTNRTAVAPNLAELEFKGYKVFYTGGNRQKIFHIL